MRHIAIVLCLVGCGNKSAEHATPKGTKVIEWEASKSDREAFRAATFANKTTRDDAITVKACADDLKLKLHVESGTATYTEADHPMTIVAPAAITLTVEDGKGFEITKGKCDGPNYELTAPGTAPGFTITDCHLKAVKPNNECAPFFQLKGDGSVMN